MTKHRTNRARTSRGPESNPRVLGLSCERPLLTGAIGLVAGTVVGALFWLTRRAKPTLSKGTDELSRRAKKLKDSVSELAVEGYEKSQSAANLSPENLNLRREGQGSRTPDQNPLVIAESTA